MEEDQVSIERIGAQQYLKVHRACAVVHSAEVLIFCRVGMGNALYERTGWIRRRRVQRACDADDAISGRASAKAVNPLDVDPKAIYILLTGLFYPPQTRHPPLSDCLGCDTLPKATLCISVYKTELLSYLTISIVEQLLLITQVPSVPWPHLQSALMGHISSMPIVHVAPGQ